MGNRSRILIIVDDQHAKLSLKTVLEFIGLEVVITPYSDWDNALPVQAEAYLTTILEGNHNLSAMVQRFINHCPDMPLITYNKDNSFELPTSKQTKQIVSRLSGSLTYGKMLESLHMAQIYRSHCIKEMSEFEGDVQLFKNIVGCSKRIRQVRGLMMQVMNKDVSVFITGESGTGKEIVARNLHQYSNRSEYPFVPINCGAIPAELLESELFGHEKGAFTGAISARKGRFELANKGTLFLDEIGDMPINMQVKLLRVLQEQSFERVGGSESIQVDVRIIAATHRNLEKMVTQGTFREDLYYRLNVFPIEMPPLRERAEDIPLILNDITSRIEKQNRSSIRFNSAALLSLCKHPWQGNVRELINLVERLSIMYPLGTIGLTELPEKFRHINQEQIEKYQLSSEGVDIASSSGTSILDELAVLPVNGLHLKNYLARIEKKLIEQALDSCNNVVARAANKLQIRRTTLVEKMRKYELHRYAIEETNER